MRPGCARRWRRCCARDQGGSEPWLPVHLLVAPAFQWDIPARLRPGYRKTGPWSPRMGLAAVSELDLGPGDDRKLRPSPREELGSEQTWKGRIA